MGRGGQLRGGGLLYWGRGSGGVQSIEYKIIS